MGHICVGEERLRQLTDVSRFVAETCNMASLRIIPIPGQRRSRIRWPSCTRYCAVPRAYEHTRPARVGNTTRMLVSELAGKASLLAKASSLGIDLDAYPDKVQVVLDDVKKHAKYKVILMRWPMGRWRCCCKGIWAHTAPILRLESFRVIVDVRDTGARAKDAMSEATIKIHVGAERFVATGEGAGPVGALDNALRMALARFYPEVADIELVDYKVRILDENVGTDAITRVVITTRDRRQRQLGNYRRIRKYH